MKDQLSKVKGALVYLMVSVRVRILDFGGWLDTWFAEYGQILNLAVLTRPFGSIGGYLAVDVLFRLDTEVKLRGKSSGKVVVIASSDPSFSVTRQRRLIKTTSRVCRNNLLLAVLSLCELDKLPKGDITFRIESPVPPGASMGTSAAVSVALIKAINQLRQAYGLPIWDNTEIAEKAFLAETKVMGGQSGTQDQWSAAFPWAAKVITVEKYPKTVAKQAKVPAQFLSQLEKRLITVFVGSHNSSDTHLRVIAAREKEGAESSSLLPIRNAVSAAMVAVEQGDLLAFGEAMTANTEAQRAMCAELVGSKHHVVIGLALENFCLGYKVNGAGGEGGSVTLLFENRKEAEHFHAALVDKYPELSAYEHKF